MEVASSDVVDLVVVLDGFDRGLGVHFSFVLCRKEGPFIKPPSRLERGDPIV